MDNYYTRLQLAPDASGAAISKAYRRLAKTCHPDLHPGNDGLAQQFIRLTEAYSVLSDPAARARYDEERFAAIPLHAGAEPWPPHRPFGKNSGPRASPQAMRKKAEPFFSHEDLSDIGMFLLAVMRSPITYCVLIAFLLLYGFRELISGAGPQHKP